MASSLFVGALLLSLSAASPTPTENEVVTPVARAASSSAAITNSAQLSSSMSMFENDFKSLAAAVSVGEAIFTQIVPLPGPTGAAQAEQELQTILSAKPQDIFQSGMNILFNGLAGGDYADIANAYLFEDSTNNFNPINPNPPVYPSAGSSDAPYSISEQQLRAAIYIPPSFTYGKMTPVIFLPGTGDAAGQNFGPNFGKLFVQNKVADPVYVNTPQFDLGDLQVASEYAAYAINYISAISGHKNVTTLSWSAGSINGQWAFKYWPSTQSKVSDAVRISGDTHGTIEAQILCPGFVTPGCTPGIAQQNYNSTFIQTLRNNGGDSAYVPTTSIYSIFDEIVEPQQDPNASAALNDARGVGVSNVEVQKACTAVLPGGTFYNSHEGVLYNALAYALAVDAIKNPGPGQLSRVDVEGACEMFAAPGLSLADIFATEALIPIAGFNILAYEPKVATEPPIMAYAAKDTPAS